MVAYNLKIRSLLCRDDNQCLHAGACPDERGVVNAYQFFMNLVTYFSFPT